MDFTAVGNATPFASFQNGETISWGLSGTFTGTVILESSVDPVTVSGLVTRQTLTSATTTTYKHEGSPLFYRLRCTAIGNSETITATIGEQAGQVVESFKDSSGAERLQVIDGGVKVPGTFESTGNATVGGDLTITGEVTGITLKNATYTASGAIAADVSFVELNKSNGALAMTIAAPAAGRVLVITQIDAGTQGHTVTLTAGTYNGTNNIATFNAAGETLVLVGISATRFAIVLNLGSVGLT